jgi:hypothetical protein
VYITDYALGRLEIFTTEGEFLAAFGGFRLSAPMDITIAADGMLDATDQTTNKLQQFKAE